MKPCRRMAEVGGWNGAWKEGEEKKLWAKRKRQETKGNGKKRVTPRRVAGFDFVVGLDRCCYHGYRGSTAVLYYWLFMSRIPPCLEAWNANSNANHPNVSGDSRSRLSFGRFRTIFSLSLHFINAFVDCKSRNLCELILFLILYRRNFS